MTLPSAASDLALLESVVREAGAIARAKFGAKVQIWQKGAAGPVTEIDYAVNDLLTARLRGERPDYGWLSEETPDDVARLNHAHVFIVDPIDGTSAFIKAKPEFTISLGIAQDQRAWVGAIYNPITDEMFTGIVGEGAWLNGAPVRVTACKRLEDSSLIGSKVFYADKRWPQPWPEEIKFTPRQSIAYRLGLVGAGQFDGVMLFGPKNEWDIAAGVAIVEAAGGKVSDLWGDPLRFNQADPRTPGAVAAGPDLHPLLIERTSRLPDPRPEHDKARQGQ